MSTTLFPFKKALQVFGASPESLADKAIPEASLPSFARSASDNRPLKSWSLNEMPQLGERIGFMSKPVRPVAISLFVTKGGVLKSSLTFNLARLAALHGIRTCVVGLDMQGDVSTALGIEDLPDEDASLEDAVARMDSLRGLADLYSGDANLDELLKPTDLPTLFYIPETPELVALDQSLIHRNRREYWLRDQVVNPLKEKFDLVLMDCSPNWNRLITNALVASDVLLSPLECKINNFRNFKNFRVMIEEFRAEMNVDFAHLFVPTRLTPTRKLSREIFDWYRQNLEDCTVTPIRESTQGEEATAMRMSVPEYAPTSAAAHEMRELTKEIWSIAVDVPRATMSQTAARRGAELTL